MTTTDDELSGDEDDEDDEGVADAVSVLDETTAADIFCLFCQNLPFSRSFDLQPLPCVLRRTRAG